MSNLVARLRDGAVSPYVAWQPVNVLRREAAAEIEHLRDRIYELERDVERAEYESLDTP